MTSKTRPLVYKIDCSCPECGDTFEEIESLAVHIDGVHTNKYWRNLYRDLYLCWCREHFNNKYRMADHLLEVGIDNLEAHWLLEKLGNKP